LAIIIYIGGDEVICDYLVTSTIFFTDELVYLVLVRIFL